MSPREEWTSSLCSGIKHSTLEIDVSSNAFCCKKDFFLFSVLFTSALARKSIPCIRVPYRRHAIKRDDPAIFLFSLSIQRENMLSATLPRSVKPPRCFITSSRKSCHRWERRDFLCCRFTLLLIMKKLRLYSCCARSSHPRSNPTSIWSNNRIRDFT